jgi:hypothetical protein
MKLLRFFFLLIPFLTAAQKEEVKTFSSFGVNAGLDVLQASDLSYYDFQFGLKGADLGFESESAQQVTPDRLYSRQSLSAYLRLRLAKNKILGPFKQFYLQIGSTFSTGQNLSYEFSETWHKGGDTVFITENNVTSVYTRDSVFNKRTTYNSYMKNIGVASEFLLSSGSKSAGFTCGLGASFQMSLANSVSASQVTYYETALYSEKGVAEFYQDGFLPAQGNAFSSNDFGIFSQDHKLNTNYLLTSYLPFKFEAFISDKPFWSQLSMEFTAKIAYEMLFIPKSSFSGRLSYGLGVGMNYYL